MQVSYSNPRAAIVTEATIVVTLPRRVSRCAERSSDSTHMHVCLANSYCLCLGAQLAISAHNCIVLANSRFPMSIFKRTQRKYVKKAYRVQNWREYEAGLLDRGSLTVWISLTDGKLRNWDAPRPIRRKPGRQRKYSNHAIGTAVALSMVFHLAPGSHRPGEQPTAQPQHCSANPARQTKVAYRIGLQQTEQSRDKLPSLQGHRGLGDASQRAFGTESRGKDRVQDSEHHDGARDA